MSGDFWGVSAVFVPTGDARILTNLRLFSARVRRQGLPLLIVELAAVASPFLVRDDEADRVVRLRTSTVLWHKERLLNLALRHLPSECRYVAWLDADVLFENDQWVAATREQLEHVAVVQPFETACWLPDGMTSAPAALPDGYADGHQAVSFAAALDRADERQRMLTGSAGHPGFAWAAQRTLLDRHGLYDRAILGGGDLINAHAFAADGAFLFGAHFYQQELTAPQRAAIARWGTGVARDTAGRVGWTPGRVCHLFHGPLAQRQYLTRQQILRDAQFDPVSDLAEDANGCWRWNSEKPELHRRVRDYFVSRAISAAVA